MPSSWPVVIVTGANGGVGFGICERLFSQLCSTQPKDAKPQPFPSSFDDTRNFSSPAPCDGITLIMACRSTKRAEIARLELLKFLDARVAYLKTQQYYDGHAEKFRQNVEVVCMRLDLADISTVFRFADEVTSRYPYVSHLICNAGLASFDSIHWPSAIKQILLDPMGAVSQPQYYLQHKGEESADGFGWVWQCNFFGHFVLFRALEACMAKSPLTSRVVWMSSLEASPLYYNLEDWQCKANEHSYETTKYQIDLVGTLLDRLALQDPNQKIPRHFVVQPGICSTSISDALVGPTFNFLKLLTFYVARLFNSPHHTISPFKAAISAVYVALVPLIFVTYLSGAINSGAYPSNDSKPETEEIPVRFGAETNQWGSERVGLTPVKEWKKFEKQTEYLLEKCDNLYQEVKGTQSTSSAGNGGTSKP